MTSDSYPDNVDAYNTNPVGDNKPTNKGTPNGALRTTLVETARNFACEMCNVLTWAGDLTPNNSDII